MSLASNEAHTFSLKLSLKYLCSFRRGRHVEEDVETELLFRHFQTMKYLEFRHLTLVQFWHESPECTEQTGNGNKQYDSD